MVVLGVPLVVLDLPLRLSNLFWPASCSCFLLLAVELVMLLVEWVS